MTWLSMRATAEQAMTTVSLHFSRLTGASLIPDWCGRLAAGLIHRLCADFALGFRIIPISMSSSGELFSHNCTESAMKDLIFREGVSIYPKVF